MSPRAPVNFLKSPLPIILFISILFFALSPFSLIHSKAFAATYHVDATNGKDTNNGLSEAAAWKTIAQVNASRFSPGDQVLLKRGEIWRETLVPPSSGTPGYPIVFGAYGTGPAPTLKGSIIVTNWAVPSGWQDGATYTTTPGDQTGAYPVDCRSVIPANTVGYNGTKVRFTVTAHSTNESTFDAVTFGAMTTGAVFDASPTRVTFNSGLRSVTIAGGRTATSDDIQFSFDKTKRYGFHTSQPIKSSKQIVNYGDGYYVNLSNNQSTTLDMTTAMTATNFIYAITKIEIYVSYSNIWKATTTTEPKVVLFDGVRGQKKASVGALPSAKDWFWESNTLYVYADSDPDTLYTSPGIEAMARYHGVLAIGISHLTVQDLNIIGGNSYPIIFTWNGPGSNIIVQRCTVSHGANTGIWFWQQHKTDEATSVLVDSCTVYENGQSGIAILGAISTTTIANNTVHHNNWQSDWNHSGIKTNASKAGLIVERNDVYSQYNGAGSIWNTGSGIWLDTPAPGSIVRYNYVHDNPTVGIVIEDTDNTEIYYNLITGNGTSDDADTGDSGILIYRHSSGTKIYNNTLYGNRAGIALRGENADERNMKNNLIKNNICHNSTNEELIATFGAENDGTMGSGNVYTYNGFGPERANFTRWGSAVFKSTYAAFDSAYGGATHSIVGNPLFVNPTGTPPEFRLLPKSPCIDAGTDVGLLSDRDGNGKYGAAWDIGAYEWRPSSSVSPPQNLKIIP